jgi:hypothetical protein
MSIFLIIGLASITMGVLAFQDVDAHSFIALILAGLFLVLVDNIGVNNLLVFNVPNVPILKISIAWLSFLGFIIFLSLKIWQDLIRS